MTTQTSKILSAESRDKVREHLKFADWSPASMLLPTGTPLPIRAPDAYSIYLIAFTLFCVGEAMFSLVTGWRANFVGVISIASYFVMIRRFGTGVRPLTKHRLGALIDDPDEPHSAVQIKFAYPDGKAAPRDQGVLHLCAGWLIYSGQTTRFSLQAKDVALCRTISNGGPNTYTVQVAVQTDRPMCSLFITDLAIGAQEGGRINVARLLDQWRAEDHNPEGQSVLPPNKAPSAPIRAYKVEEYPWIAPTCFTVGAAMLMGSYVMRSAHQPVRHGQDSLWLGGLLVCLVTGSSILFRRMVVDKSSILNRDVFVIWRSIVGRFGGVGSRQL